MTTKNNIWSMVMLVCWVFTSVINVSCSPDDEDNYVNTPPSNSSGSESNDDNGISYEIVGTWEATYTWIYSGAIDNITMEINKDGTLSFLNVIKNSNRNTEVGSGSWTYNKTDHSWNVSATYSLIAGVYRMIDNKLVNYQYFDDGSSRVITFSRKTSNEGNKDNNINSNKGEDHGHEWVDLGLSVKWATCNVGASSPEDFGDYYAWGETTTKSTYSWATYKWCKGTRNTITKYCKYKTNGSIDNKEVLEASDDVAHVKWGGNWKMPTEDDIYELTTKCNWEWTTNKGVAGYKVTSKTKGTSIFLPAAGHNYEGVDYVGVACMYWTSTLALSDSESAYYLKTSSSFVDYGDHYRCVGVPVRPVCP